MPLPARPRPARLLPLVAALGACTAKPPPDAAGATPGPDSGAAADTAAPTPTGIDRHLGQAVVDEETVADGITTRRFSTTAGRTGCLRGAPFSASTADRGSDDLVIFLQGGGACWDDFCLAVTAAPAGIPAVDILDPTTPDNPVADWNVAYVPYCDGSLFVGDRDHDDDDDGTAERQHRGLANLSAALDMARETLPPPRRVLFAGSSGGGFGVLLASPLVRAVFPDAELIVLADSAQGLGRGPADPDFVAHVVDQWGAASVLPAGCTDCLADGHMTGVPRWLLDQDPALRIGMFSAWYDLVIGDVFLQIPPADFAAALAETGDALHGAHPDRFRRFVVDGRVHTALLGDASGIIGDDLGAVELPPEALSALAGLELGAFATTTSADGRPLTGWVAGLIDDDARWEDVVDAPGPVPD